MKKQYNIERNKFWSVEKTKRNYWRQHYSTVIYPANQPHPTAMQGEYGDTCSVVNRLADEEVIGAVNDTRIVAT